MANNSKGMSHVEMVRAVGNCLRGSRKQAYNVKLKSARHDGRLKGRPDACYCAIVARLQQFKEGILEKQQRLNGGKAVGSLSANTHHVGKPHATNMHMCVADSPGRFVAPAASIACEVRDRYHHGLGCA